MSFCRFRQGWACWVCVVAVEVGVVIFSLLDLRPSSSGGACTSRLHSRGRNVGSAHLILLPLTASSWIQCSWILRQWTTWMHTVTSRPSSWRSVQRSVSGPILSGTSSSPCKVSE